jgi:hypothetical protein
MLASTDETDSSFRAIPCGTRIAKIALEWGRVQVSTRKVLNESLLRINEIVDVVYSVASDRLHSIVASSLAGAENEEDEDSTEDGEVDEPRPLEEQISIQDTSKAVLSLCFGSLVGRWDCRSAFNISSNFMLSPAFESIPQCAPGMLQGANGLLLLDTPLDYPIRIDWDGILVDDPDHQDDVVRRVREVLEVIWRDQADAIEKEACEILSVKDLRDYFRKTGKDGFWGDHVSRYTKSRRKAPIYWLLQSSKKNYALWIYYHRLDKDILFKALLNYIEPKLRLEESRLDSLRSQKQAGGVSGKAAKKVDQDIERQDDLLSELRDFEEKLRRAANLHLEPDLNDGVVLNIAPLHELVPWKEAKSYWEELLEGKYEWSSIGKQLREKRMVR